MFYRLARFVLWLYLAVFHRISIMGLERLDGVRKPVVLAANHESYLDPPAVGVAYPEPLRFIAWDGLFRVPILGPLIRALGAVPVSPENKGSAAGLLRQVMGFLEDGHSVLIFPEGQRTMDGTLQPLEGGVALLSMKTGSPIVPVWIDGTYEAMSPHVTLPRPRKVAVTFGNAIDPSELPADMPDKEKRKALLAELEAALVAMRDGAK